MLGYANETVKKSFSTKSTKDTNGITTITKWI